MFEVEQDDYETVDPNNFPAFTDLPKDFLIVQFEVKRKQIYYAAKVIEEKGNNTEVSFLRLSDECARYCHDCTAPY